MMTQENDFRKEILNGLTRSQKSISPKFLYDERGSEIFEQICKLEEYYPVHAELEILKSHAKEIGEFMGEAVTLIEPGCGNCLKVQLLLEELVNPHAYVALDISKDFLLKTVSKLRGRFPKIPVYPVVADYTRGFALPLSLQKSKNKRVIFFPGSTVGNLNPREAKHLLKRMAKIVRSGGGLLIGVDMKKDSQTLELAYDDPQGVTAEFNYNLLDRLNRELSASFDRKNFRYRAKYNAQKGRVEMFLVSQIPQRVRIGQEIIYLNQNETIHTEDSYKYSPAEFNQLAESAGFTLRNRWMDGRERFCVYYFERNKIWGEIT